MCKINVVATTAEGKKKKMQIDWPYFDPANNKVCGTPVNLVFRIELIQKIRPSDQLWLHSQAQKCEARPFGLDMKFLALHASTPVAALEPECDREMFYVCAERLPGMTDHYLVPMKYCQVVTLSTKLKKVAAKATAALGLNENDEDRAIA